jgi:hypothetical protein
MADRHIIRRRLSDADLERLLSKERLEAFSMSRFGGVMLTADVFSGHRIADIMFREEPDLDLPFSGWVFLSSEESPTASPEERGLALHDVRAILRFAPEVAGYLEMPPGTQLFRTGADRFEADFD